MAEPVHIDLSHRPRSCREADQYFGLLRDTILNRFYKNLVPIEHSPDWVPWGRYSYSGIGHESLNNLRYCCEDVLTRGVKGEFVEAGIWRGGCVIYMALLAQYYGHDRMTWGFDSFEGMPPLNTECPHEVTDYLALTGLAVSMKEVLQGIQLFRLEGTPIRLVPGWLKDTLDPPPDDLQSISVLRLDNDYYESTKLSLNKLYPLVSRGGWVIVDDYDCVPGATTAVSEYRAEHQVTSPLFRMNRKDGVGVYWQKP